MNENKIICFTGHRKIPDAHSIALVEALEEEVTRQILSGERSFAQGVRLGLTPWRPQPCCAAKKRILISVWS